MLTPEVEEFARSHHGTPTTRSVDDVTDEVAVEFSTEEAARTFAAAAREKGLPVRGPWRWPIDGFPEMVTVWADSE